MPKRRRGNRNVGETEKRVGSTSHKATSWGVQFMLFRIQTFVASLGTKVWHRCTGTTKQHSADSRIHR